MVEFNETLTCLNNNRNTNYKIEQIGKYTENGFVCKLGVGWIDYFEEDLSKGNLLKYVNSQQEEKFMSIEKVQLFNSTIYLYLDYVSALEYIGKMFQGRMITK